MTTGTGSCVHDNSSLTNFKAWAQTISNMMTALGWTQTADTGQVNWSTISEVPSSTYVYEVWQATDSFASSLPIKVKWEYGYSSTVVRARVTVGTASDGAGTITGYNTVALLLGASYTTNNGTTAFSYYYSGTTGRLSMVFWASTSSSYYADFILNIERSKSAAGADTADFFTVNSYSGEDQAPSTSNYGCLQQTFTASASGLALVSPVTIAADISVTSTYQSGVGTVAALPIFPLFGAIKNPLIGLVTAYGTDVGQLSTVTVSSFYGGTHTYIAYRGSGVSYSQYCLTGYFGQRQGGNSGAGSGLAALILYE